MGLTSSWPPAHVEVGSEGHFPGSKLRGPGSKLRGQITDQIMSFFKNGNLRFLTHRHIAEISARYRRQNDRTDAAHLFCFQKIHTKHNLDSFFQGAFFGEVFAQQGRARGPGARGPYGPWPIWALARVGPGPYGP